MPRFEYKGKRKGDKVVGEIVADNERDARRKLKAERISADKLKQKSFPVVRQFGPFGGVSKKELLNFSNKLATMIRSGLPMIDAIK